MAGILNFVDEKIYREQIDKTIQSMLKHIRLVQPNGEWVLKEYETDIRANKSGIQCIVLAANFVDAKNEEDMRYQNGVPLVDVKVDVSNSNKELIEAIQAQGLSGQNSGDPEVKALLMKLTELMIAEKEKLNQTTTNLMKTLRLKSHRPIFKSDRACRFTFLNVMLVADF